MASSTLSRCEIHRGDIGGQQTAGETAGEIDPWQQQQQHRQYRQHAANNDDDGHDNDERYDDDDAAAYDNDDDEETDTLNDARRFQDFETIDWIQDTLFERSRRLREASQSHQHPRHRRTSSASSPTLSRSRRSSSPPPRSRSWLGLGARRSAQLSAWYTTILHATQSWLVVLLVGAGIGLNAALIDVVTSWLTDVKFGYCRVNWWLNSKFCCWEIQPTDEGEACADWHSWSESFFGIGYTVYVLYAVAFAFSAAYIVRSFAPYAAGSGISEIKCILAGFIMKGFLGLATLAIKSLTLPLAIASGLSVGKEGPSVHVACAIGAVVGRSFNRFSRSQAKMREIVTAASAAGVAVAFGSPIGGVLFALEEMTVNFPIKTMWRSFFCALVATMTLSAMNPFRTGKLVLFQVSYDRDWHFFEIGGFILIGVFGGLYGAFVIKYNLQVQSFRRKHLASHGVAEAVVLAALTALVGYHNRFLRIDMTESLDILFRECEAKDGDYDGLCQTWAQWRMVNSLLLATVFRIALIIISYGAKVPAGIFVPSMAVGATFGRMVGILVKATYRAFPHWAIFAACEPEKPCITPGTYAFLGAAAALGGIMRITVTVVVIMFELTGALTYILPTMIVLMVTKAVSDQFGKGGIADQMIRFNGFPFLDKEDHQFNETVSHVMKRNTLSLPASGVKLHDLQARFIKSEFRGLPVVRSGRDTTLLGYITRADLTYAIDKIRRSGRRLGSDTLCTFAKPDLEEEEDGEDEDWRTGAGIESRRNAMDFSPWVNETVLTVSPKQPLEIVMQLFKKMGPRVILVEEQGQLRGLISIKDILKEIIAHEQSHSSQSRGAALDVELDLTLEEGYEWITARADSLGQMLGLRRKRVQLDEQLPMRRAAEQMPETPQRPSSRLGNPFDMGS